MTDREETAALSLTDSTSADRVATTPRRLGLGKTFAALHHRNYRLYFVGQLISLTGMWMQSTAQPWLVYLLTGSPLYLGIVSFASSIPPLTLSLWAGVLVDRVPKRRLLLVTQVTEMTLAFLLALDVFLGLVQAWHIVVFAVLLGIANTFDAPARQSFVIEMVGRKDLMNAVALNSATFQMGRIIGPGLAGILLAVLGPAWCFLINGLSFIAVITALLKMSVQERPGAPKQGSAFSQLREGLAYIMNDQTMRTLFAMVAVANMFAVGYIALLPAFAQDVLRTGPTGFGLMGAAIGGGALTAALGVASLGTTARKGLILTMGNLLLPITVLLFAVSPFYSLSLFTLFAAGFAFMTQNTIANTLIQTTVPDNLRGRVMATYAMIFFGLFPFSSLIAGFIAEHSTVQLGAAFGGAVALTFSLFWLWRAPHVRSLI